MGGVMNTSKHWLLWILIMLLPAVLSVGCDQKGTSVGDLDQFSIDSAREDLSSNLGNPEITTISPEAEEVGNQPSMNAIRTMDPEAEGISE